MVDVFPCVVAAGVAEIIEVVKYTQGEAVNRHKRVCVLLHQNSTVPSEVTVVKGSARNSVTACHRQ